MDLSILQQSEKNVLALRSLYASHGYELYRMSKFEEYDLYARNKDFLLSDNVITFTDPDGSLKALRPDVTLSIIKNLKELSGVTRKLCYNENVYRVDSASNGFRESMQCGLECIGRVGKENLAEVLLLAAESLSLFSDDWLLAVSDISLTQTVLGRSKLPDDGRERLYRAVGERNLPLIRTLCERYSDPQTEQARTALLSASASAAEALPDLGEESLLLDAVFPILRESPFADRIRIDFSVTADSSYYNGLVIKGFLKGIPEEVLSGGMYDNLMERLGRPYRAVGFAVYADRLVRPVSGESSDDGFLNVALPKGRLGEKVYASFAKAGFECPAVLEPGRKLIFENPEKKVRYFWVKPSDVAIYVERGAADVGVAGKDVLLEQKPEVYELLDLRQGVCRMAVAAPRGFTDSGEGTLRVATKFSSIAREYYASVGRDIDIIHLNGSIEIAPILGLSDVIVDIVETGSTLRENDLEVKETVVPISARLIANKASYKFKYAALKAISEGLGRIVAEDEA